MYWEDKRERKWSRVTMVIFNDPLEDMGFLGDGRTGMTEGDG